MIYIFIYFSLSINVGKQIEAKKLPHHKNIMWRQTRGEIHYHASSSFVFGLLQDKNRKNLKLQMQNLCYFYMDIFHTSRIFQKQFNLYEHFLYFTYIPEAI